MWNKIFKKIFKLINILIKIINKDQIKNLTTKKIPLCLRKLIRRGNPQIECLLTNIRFMVDQVMKNLTKKF